MKQIKVSLPDVDVAMLDQAAYRSRLSLSGEIRKRLARSLAEDGVRADVLRLERKIRALIDLIETQCGRRWSEHPTTARVLQLAIDALLARYGVRDNLKFAPGELPDVPLLAAGTDDPAVIAIGIEAVVHYRTMPQSQTPEISRDTTHVRRRRRLPG